MKGLLALIQKLYGKNILSKTIGTRTNVIKLPTNEVKDFIKKDLNIEAASDKLAQKAYEDIKELIPDIPKMNDAERLILEGNLKRLDRKLNPPMAEITEFGTKQKVSPEGIKTLIQEKGQKAPPGTMMGNIESRIKQLEASGKDLETIAKEKGAKGLEDIMADALKSQGLSKQMYNEGLVRATARDIITSDIKSGKLKLPKELEQNMLEGGGEPIDVLRNVYGEDALEVLDSLIPEFSKLRTSTEAADLAKSKFKFEPDVNRPKGSMTPEEAAKAEQENILVPKKPGEPEEFAMGGRAGYSAGSIVKGVLLTAKKLSELKPEYLKKLSRLEGYLGSINMDAKGGREAAKQTMDKIDNLKKEYKALQKDLSEKEQLDKFDVTDRVSHAGGGISQGLDYLMGIERQGYANGSLLDRYNQILAEMKSGQQSNVLSPKILYLDSSDGSSGFNFSTPTKEESEYAMDQGMTDVGENKFGRLGSMIAGGLLSAINPVFGMAYSLADPNSLTRQVLSKIGYNPVTEGSIHGPFGGYNDFTGTEGTFTTDTSDTGASQDTSGPPGGTNASGGPGEDYATGGRVGYRYGGLSYLMGM